MRFMLDSGAFTSFNSGKPIQIDDYCRFLDGLPVKPWRYYALDVIGDHDGTLKNYETMLARGYDPIPVVTYGQDLSVVEYYYSKTDFIAYGGLVGRSTAEKAVGVNQFQKVVNGRKSHLLGFTSMPYIKHFQPYSCDSSSWEGGARFGNANIYAGNGKMIKARKADFSNRPSKKIIDACITLKIDPSRAKREEEWKGRKSFLRHVSAASWVKMSLDCEVKIKTKLFLAFVTDDAGSVLYDAYKRLTHV